jgi:hypothetical protein
MNIHFQDTTVTCYNRLKNQTKKVEYDLIASELAEIDLQLERAEHALNWNSEGSKICFIFKIK